MARQIVSRWRIKAREVIARVLEETKGQEYWQIKKAIRAAYPFGERRCEPYKIWLYEVRQVLGIKRNNWHFRNGDEPYFLVGKPLTVRHDFIFVECPWCAAMAKNRNGELKGGCFRCADLHEEIRKWLAHPDFVELLNRIKRSPDDPFLYSIAGDWLADMGEDLGLYLAFQKKRDELSKPKTRKVKA